MNSPPASIRALAQRLLAIEAGSESASNPQAHEAVRVCEKLRVSLSRFAGGEGFASLMRRALVLARAEVPSLSSVQVNADGSIAGLETLTADASRGGNTEAVVVTAHLLGLLVTFIGEPITLRLVRDAWPNMAWDEQHGKKKAP